MGGILKHAPKGGQTTTRKPLVPSKTFLEAMEHFNTGDQIIRDQAIKLVKKKNDLILQTLKKAGANIDDIPQLAKDCENHIMPDKREILHYKGKVIIEFYPPESSPIKRDGLSFTMDSGFSYRILI